MKIKYLAFLLTFVTANLAAQNQSGINRDNMDTKVRPGTDFYQYAAGGWIKNNPVPPDFSNYGQVAIVNKQNNERIRDLIIEMSSQNFAPGSEQQKIGDLYNLMMDSVRLNREGAKPILPYLKEIDRIKNIREYQIAGAKFLLYGINIGIFKMGIIVDKEDASKHLIAISQGGLSLGQPEYYLSDDKFAERLRESYTEYIAKLFTLAGTPAKTAKKYADDILKFETRIAKISKTKTELRNVKENYHKMSYSDLVENFEGVDWGNILLHSGIPAVDSVSVNQPKFVKGVEQIYKETSLQLLKTYAKFTILHNSTHLLDDNFQQAAFDLKKVTSGAVQDKQRWEKSVQYVNSSLGMAVGKIFVQKYFPESSKQRMLAIVGNLREALRQRINETLWMSSETKAKACEKLDSIYIQIGYPDNWYDISALEIDPKKPLLVNAFEISRFTMTDYIARNVNKPVDRTEWTLTPQTVNAGYYPSLNKICFPAGILQPPFFNPDADEACNYGAIGVIIGHEMTHGFDDQGSQYDSDGNLNNWWAESDRQQFDARTDVMRKFFDNLDVLPGLKANGSLTLGENIADNGGLNVAFRAMKNYMVEHPLQVLDGFTPEQRFFLSYGFIWAENQTEQSRRNQVINDVHANGCLRVNGALPHIDQWYKAFNIKKKDPMYVAPTKRVRVW
ncbi:MAG: M13 family metallopeptidase [Bacteroidales bacterium]|nr:M13 family metallopeptidase [Bacteroidales bacterium]